MVRKTKDIALAEKRSFREDERRRLNREAILRAAETLICRKGFTETSMDDVAVEAGFSKATVYKYVRSKSELVFELLVDFLETMNARLGEINGRPVDPVVRLKALIREVLRLQVEKEHLAKAFLSDHSLFRLVHSMVEARDGRANETEREFLRRIVSAQRAVSDRVESLFKEGIAAGAFRPVPLDAAVRFLGMLAQGYRHGKFFREAKPDLEKDVSDIYTFILYGIVSKKQASE